MIPVVAIKILVPVSTRIAFFYVQGSVRVCGHYFCRQFFTRTLKFFEMMTKVSLLNFLTF